MKLDLLKAQAVSRALNDSVQYQLKRGRITALLFISSLTWHFKDKITIKLRHEGGLLTVCDRVSAYQLAELCDLKQGRPSTGTSNYAQDENGDDPAGYVTTNPGQRSLVNAFTLPIGHLTLDGAAELEVTIDTQQQGAVAPATSPATGVIKIVGVQGPRRTDTVLCYDMLNDLESTQHNVREAYLSAVNGISFFPTTGVGTPDGVDIVKAKDIIVRLDSDGEMGETDVETFGAMTAITGELSTAPGGLVRIFQEHGTLPATLGLKVFGSDAAAAQLLFIREVNIPHMTSNSLVQAVAHEQRKVEVLEQNDPERARALIQNGTIKPSEVLQAAKDSIKPLAVPASA